MLEKKTMKKIEKQTTPKCSKATAIAPFRSMRCVRATVIFIGQRLVWPAGIGRSSVSQTGAELSEVTAQTHIAVEMDRMAHPGHINSCQFAH